MVSRPDGSLFIRRGESRFLQRMTPAPSNIRRLQHEVTKAKPPEKEPAIDIELNPMHFLIAVVILFLFA